MAILRVITSTVALLIICSILHSTKPAVAWVLVAHRQQKHESTSGSSCSRLGQQNPVCCLSAHEENKKAATEEESWDDQVIRWVDGILEQKSEQCPLAIEQSSMCSNVVPYEWFVSQDSRRSAADNEDTLNRNIALRTTGQPLLDAESIALIRGAAQNMWERQKGSQASRFTLQFADTNTECHLDDLVASDASGKLKQVVDDLLTNKIYPLVRSAFGKDHRYGLTKGSLCVYDSLVVRYNGEKAIDRFGASQPLHGDGGVVSVNIALNSHRENDEASTIEDTFSGGGTFFEDMIQLGDSTKSNRSSCDPILRPSSKGHALAHWSTHRHAGAPTRSGTRFILVIFVAQRRAQQESSQNSFNGIERSFQLKLKARELPSEQRDMALRCLDLAIEKSPFDAQAHFWKGFHLMQGGSPNPRKDDSETKNRECQHHWEELYTSIYHFEKARECAPFDAKISCYAGMAYRQRWMFAQQHKPREQHIEDLDKAANCLVHALLLHKNYYQHGISSDFGDKVSTARITLAEVYLQQERYETALEFLSSTFREENTKSSFSEATRQHLSKLVDHCHQQLQRNEISEDKPEHSLAETASRA